MSKAIPSGGETIAPTAILAEKRMAQELEMAKIKMQAQAEKIQDLSKERDFLKEQLAASLQRQPQRSPSPMKQNNLEAHDYNEVKRGSSFISDSEQSSKDDDFSISDSDSSEKEHRKPQIPRHVVARYNKILRVFKKEGTMTAAFKRCGVDRNTVVVTAPIAELSIAAPAKFKEIEQSAPKKLLEFAAQCADMIAANPKLRLRYSL
ncbi:hypothetical protein WMY93_033527 [Mugilogobius chulae]|uniref:Coiled-coil domain-containing protein 106 n=1 Tax=Mugilogobius chulae TaxID=88201 RepID=A0AAW0MSN1_9GOBI